MSICDKSTECATKKEKQVYSTEQWNIAREKSRLRMVRFRESNNGMKPEKRLTTCSTRKERLKQQKQWREDKRNQKAYSEERKRVDRMKRKQQHAMKVVECLNRIICVHISKYWKSGWLSTVLKDVMRIKSSRKRRTLWGG